MSYVKKQAKYFNKLCKECNIDNIEKETNIRSPYKYAIKSIKENNIMDAAKIYNENGSLLERNIKMLLARADENDFVSLIDMLPNKNPIVLYQLIENIDQDNKKRILLLNIIICLKVILKLIMNICGENLD